MPIKRLGVFLVASETAAVSSWAAMALILSARLGNKPPRLVKPSTKFLPAN